MAALVDIKNADYAPVVLIHCFSIPKLAGGPKRYDDILPCADHKNHMPY
jgi:hypothetical protein